MTSEREMMQLARVDKGQHSLAKCVLEPHWRSLGSKLHALLYSLIGCVSGDFLVILSTDSVKCPLLLVLTKNEINALLSTSDNPLRRLSQTLFEDTKSAFCDNSSQSQRQQQFSWFPLPSLIFLADKILNFFSQQYQEHCVTKSQRTTVTDHSVISLDSSFCAKSEEVPLSHHSKSVASDSWPLYSSSRSVLELSGISSPCPRSVFTPDLSCDDASLETVFSLPSTPNAFSSVEETDRSNGKKSKLKNIFKTSVNSPLKLILPRSTSGGLIMKPCKDLLLATNQTRLSGPCAEPLQERVKKAQPHTLALLELDDDPVPALQFARVACPSDCEEEDGQLDEPQDSAQVEFLPTLVSCTENCVA
ncbi:hypothetical protein Ciccas_004863, partial [Cichlidogyrus casuarinus]